MFFNVESFLKQPYPYYFKGKNLWIVAAVIFIMSLGFNYVFEPFVVYRPEHKVSYFWISMIHSLNAFICVLLVIGLNNLRVNEDTWSLVNEIILISAVLLMIGISQFLVRDLIYANPDNWSFRYFWEEIRNTFLVGLLFVLILVPLNFLRLLKTHLKTAKSFNLNQSEDSFRKSATTLPIVTKQKSDDFELILDNLIVAKSEGNYLEIYVDNGDQVNKEIKRLTLKELDSQLESFPQFFKTHRSFLVNLQKIIHVKGNAQGYQLDVKGYTGPIPVSRGMIAEFERIYKKN
ncbi:LytR/AlgR family response regulator transcription factor [Arthrospiribacter ruber]|uniref:LytTR family transcriptional regulator n=1 Tax=Arthrospiribacter ruber TaxID=2487934 RepID=A0A951J0L7_9BACT|nr:LytTR family DNA-binding domain-containing protein [Arthrospiribacter ruber]MBW3468998.1 LytTR family transcriptional regulator [Arthrospiribacter ruber]